MLDKRKMFLMQRTINRMSDDDFFFIYILILCILGFYASCILNEFDSTMAKTEWKKNHIFKKKKKKIRNVCVCSLRIVSLKGTENVLFSLSKTEISLIFVKVDRE